MNEYRSLATLSVGRAVMLAYFATGVLVLGLGLDPGSAVTLAGLCSLGLCLWLMRCSSAAHSSARLEGERWEGLIVQSRPGRGKHHPEAAEILSLTYLGFARWTAGVSATFFATALVLGIVI